MNTAFANLQCKGFSHRAYTISGSGRDRKTGYRSCVSCQKGEIEIKQWQGMVRDLIHQYGEQKLYLQLVEYVSRTCFWLRTRSAAEEYALQLHSSRVFDDPKWNGFVSFNREYRPEVLENAKLVEIIPACCQKPGFVTKAQIDSSQGIRAEIACPHCGRWSRYKIN